MRSHGRPEVNRPIDGTGKGIGKPLPDALQHFRPSVNVYGTAALGAERLQVVDAVNMVGMSMSVDDGVEPPAARGKPLLAEVRPGIDDDARAFRLDQDRRPPAPVSRVVGVAGAPVAARDRHAGGAAAAENRYAQVRAFANRRKKLSVVAAAKASPETPFSSAATAAVWTT